jgi:prophage regulatory protein
MATVYLRRPEVLRRTGWSTSTLKRKERLAEFPARVVLGENSVGWREDEVEAFLKSLPRARDRRARA